MENNKSTYTEKQVREATLKYFRGDDLATNVFITKYCAKSVNNDGKTEYYELTPDDMHHRLAKEFARAGKKYENPISEEEVYELFKDFKYIVPQGRPMAGIGIDQAVSISNCFVTGYPNQDSYGVIAKVDQDIMQISKRGGGCVEENTKLIIENKGLVPIKDVNVGDKVLSFNTKTHKDEWKIIKDKYLANVKLDEQINVIYKNGVNLETSVKHPILCIDKEGNYTYNSYNSGKLIDSWNKTLNIKDQFSIAPSTQEKNDIAWLIGCHLGDGTCNKNYRIRILGNNKEIIENYKRILEKIIGNNAKVSEPHKKGYKSKVWEYTSNTSRNSSFIDNYLDGTVGLKVYTCKIPTFIKENDLYIPFLAGLIDADGYIKNNGTIDLSLASKLMISEISEYLSSHGQRFLYRIKKSKRPNEHLMYRLTIYSHTFVYNEISKFIVSDKKDKFKLNETRRFSHKIKLLKEEADLLKNGLKNILPKTSKDYFLYHSNRINMIKRNGELALPALLLAEKYSVLTHENVNEIISRTNTKEVKFDTENKKVYYDIEVEDNNNYYAGKNGFVVIHNCGVDLSDFRPDTSLVHNAANTSSGPVEICANRYSNTIREVGQSGRRGALMLSMSIKHPDVEKFIDAKLTEGKITGANISVRISDEFMKAAIEKRPYRQQFPIHSDNPITFKDIDADMLWRKITHNAWKCAEPGVLFWDTIIKESVADCYADMGYTTTSTNPCVTGDSTLFVINEKHLEFIHIADLIGKKVTMWNGLEWTEVTPFKVSDSEEIFHVEFSNGASLDCTSSHKFILKDNTRKELKDLKVNDELAPYIALTHMEHNGSLVGGYVYNKIVSITDTKTKQPVYCVTDPKNHSMYVNGLMTGNCGELPLCPHDSCRLMVLNLYSYVKNPFTDKAELDWHLLSNHSRKIMKLMDNMIDLELEKIDMILAKIKSDPEDKKIKEPEYEMWTEVRGKCAEGRRSGIGITAEGDMLAAMGLKYGTKEATNFAAKVQRVITLNAYIESCDLVQKEHRPCFKCFDFEKEKNNPFLNRLAYGIKDNYSEEFASKWQKGRRNIALLTIAPGGSVSCVTQTTSGIEPLFAVKYDRKRKIDKNSGQKADFVNSVGDWFINFRVVHNKFAVWYSIKKNIKFEDAINLLSAMPDAEFENVFELSPYYQATANDCNWLEKVKMQGEIQKYIDHSISCTVNLPKTTSEETVKELYETAWKSGCKGCTIYVDGSRDNILTIKKAEQENKSQTFDDEDAPKRPKKLPCKIVRFVNNREKWIAVVGLFENRPYEMFTGTIENLDLPSNIDEGYIIKNKIPVQVKNEETGQMEEVKKSRYDLQYVNSNGETKTIEGFASLIDKSKVFSNYSKCISGLLRHRMPINSIVKYITHSMEFDDEGFATWQNGVTRALKKYTKDEELGDVCPKCGAKLWRREGCISCPNCGYSKCS